MASSIIHVSLVHVFYKASMLGVKALVLRLPKTLDCNTADIMSNAVATASPYTRRAHHQDTAEMHHIAPPSCIQKSALESFRALKSAIRGGAKSLTPSLSAVKVEITEKCKACSGILGCAKLLCKLLFGVV